MIDLCEILEHPPAEAICAPPWESAPYQLVSWWDMKKFSGELLCMTFQLLGTLDSAGQIVQQRGGGQSPTPYLGKFRDESLRHIITWTTQLGLRTSLLYSQKTYQRLRKEEVLTHNEFLQIVRCLQEMITSEVSAVLFLHIDADRVAFLQDHNQFGEVVASRFPSAVIDVEEAAKCYGLNRHTACVMHLQRVIEVGLKSLAGKSEIDVSGNRSWESILQKLDKELEKDRGQRTDFVAKNYEAVADATAMLRSVKIAWRNPTMHVENIYDGEKALDVFGAVKAFMGSLATFVAETES